MDQINNFLYLGNEKSAKDIELLKLYQIDTIISMNNKRFFDDNHPEWSSAPMTVTEQISVPKIKINYLIHDIEDADSQDILDICIQGAEFIQSQIENQKKILVHCKAGISRSSSFIIAYFIIKHQMTYQQAFQLVLEKRPIIQPNDGFILQLRFLDFIYNNTNYPNINNLNTQYHFHIATNKSLLNLNIYSSYKKIYIYTNFGFQKLLETKKELSMHMQKLKFTFVNSHTNMQLINELHQFPYKPNILIVVDDISDIFTILQDYQIKTKKISLDKTFYNYHRLLKPYYQSGLDYPNYDINNLSSFQGITPLQQLNQELDGYHQYYHDKLENPNTILHALQWLNDYQFPEIVSKKKALIDLIRNDLGKISE